MYPKHYSLPRERDCPQARIEGKHFGILEHVASTVIMACHCTRISHVQ